MHAWLGRLFVMLCLAVASAATAQERIERFDAQLDVQVNGDLIVTETLDIVAEGKEIRRGLLRDFPTRYALPNGRQVVVGFDVLEVRRNGGLEPYKLESLDNGVRIRIGSGALLEHGPHRLEIRYRTTRLVGFFDDFDELYWNVTGTGWTLPITQASATIVLPQPADILRTAIYTGPQGAQGKAATVTSQERGRVSFATTAPLAPREGLTIAAAWPKGIVIPPTTAELASSFVHDNLGALVGLAGVLTLGLYYLFHWQRRRRRDTPMVIPRYEAPAGMSAPAVRYLMRGFDQQGFVAGVFELVAAGAMRLEGSGKKTEYRRTGDAPRQPVLQALHKALFRDSPSFSGQKTTAKRLDDAREAMQSALHTHYDKYRVPGARVLGTGIGIWMVFLVAGILVATQRDGASMGAVIFGVAFGMAGTLVLSLLLSHLRHAARRGVTLVFGLLFSLPFIIPGIAIMRMESPSWAACMPMLFSMAGIVLVVRSFSFLRAYTDEGNRLRDEIEGLKRYLSVAEAPRLQALITPEEKLATYERLMPYAIALDVGKAWAAAFAGLFAATAVEQAMLSDMQDRYGGHDVLRDDPAREDSGVWQSLATTTPSSSGSPGSSGGSSSSGSSGGGSSGGGGGGGGGSGW